MLQTTIGAAKQVEGGGELHRVPLSQLPSQAASPPTAPVINLHLLSLFSHLYFFSLEMDAYSHFHSHLNKIATKKF